MEHESARAREREIEKVGEERGKESATRKGRKRNGENGSTRKREREKGGRERNRREGKEGRVKVVGPVAGAGNSGGSLVGWPRDGSGGGARADRAREG